VILVDTPIWIDHLNHGDDRLADLLERRQVVLHPYIVGELALGSLRDRVRVLRELNRMAHVAVARHDEVMALIENFGLWSRGIGYVDLHLLAAARLAADTALWTRDKRLAGVADELGVGYAPPVH
jgi:predicted nucleic acid-binding protein